MAFNSSKFVPNLHEKMSGLVADCPTLAYKISGKEQDYCYALVKAFDKKRPNVLLNIIDEYNEFARQTSME